MKTGFKRFILRLTFTDVCMAWWQLSDAVLFFEKESISFNFPIFPSFYHLFLFSVVNEVIVIIIIITKNTCFPHCGHKNMVSRSFEGASNQVSKLFLRE